MNVDQDDPTRLYIEGILSGELNIVEQGAGGYLLTRNMARLCY